MDRSVGGSTDRGSLFSGHPFVGRVGRFKLYCCLVGKLFCYVVKKFRRCNLSKPEESVCHFWTLYINQIAFCFERFAMFDRTDPLWSQIKSAK